MININGVKHYTIIGERKKAPLLIDVQTDNSNYKVAALQMIR